MAELHVYQNGVVDWFVAESVEHAIAMAREYQRTQIGVDEEGMDLDFEQTPDDRVLRIRMEDAPDPEDEYEEHTAAEWAALSGPGFLCSTEW